MSLHLGDLINLWVLISTAITLKAMEEKERHIGGSSILAGLNRPQEPRGDHFTNARDQSDSRRMESLK